MNISGERRIQILNPGQFSVTQQHVQLSRDTDSSNHQESTETNSLDISSAQYQALRAKSALLLFTEVSAIGPVA